MSEREKRKVRHNYLKCLLLLMLVFQSITTAFSLLDQGFDDKNKSIKVPQLKGGAFNKTLFNNTNNDLDQTNPELSTSFKHLKEETTYVQFPVRADIQSGWGAPSFQYRKNITIDCDKVATNLSDFPVLVVLFDNDLRYHTQVAGDDILFIDSTNTTLDHEIEHFDLTYNGSHALLVAWIRIPFLSSNLNTTISMYYGNSTIESQENVTGVWDSSYKGVWHLGESGNGDVDEYRDSTLYANHGEGGGSIPTQVSAEIGYAQEFDGSERYISIPSSSSLELDTHLTIEAWVKIAGSSGDYMGIAGKLDDTDDNGYTLVRHSDNRFRFWVGNGGMSSVDSDNTYTDSDWHHVVGVIDDGTNYLYIDGTLQTDTDSRDLVDSHYEAHIGRQYYNYDNRFWNGIIDEVRISEISRLAEWITTEYNNQNDPASFCAIGVEEQRDSDAPPNGLDVIIDTDVYDATDEYNPGPNIVFINDSHGYIFFQKTNGSMAEIVYYKTIDNGTTWEGPMNIDCGSDDYRFRSFSCWFDQWTPNNTGTKIHIIVNSIMKDEMVYNYLDTKDDTSSGEWTVIMASGGAHNAPDGGGTVTVSTEGVIYGASWMDNGPQFAKYNTSWYDITPPYSFLNDDDDHGQLLPLSDGDILCVYEDSTSNSLYSFAYDDNLNMWDVSPTLITTLSSEIEAPEDNYNNNANWGATINLNTHNIYLVLNNDILNVTGDLESWVFYNHNRSWNQKTDVVTDCGLGGDEVKPVYDISNNTLFAIYINNKTVFVKNSTDGGDTWGSENKVSTVEAAWIVLRTNFVSSERIYAIYFDNENNDVYGKSIADLQRGPGNATVRVNVLDLDNKIVPNARVNITNAYNAAINWTQNTTSSGYTIFTNLSYDYYNISVEFEDSINNTLSFLEFSTNSTYQLNPKYEFTARVSEFTDNDPPTVQNVYFVNESILFDNSSTFFADVWDNSNFKVFLNLSIINITNEIVLIYENFTMEECTSDQFYNATALDSLTHRNVQIFYNIIAIDLANNTMVTQINSFYLGDVFPPIIVEYNVTDYRNGTLQFYANITDNMSVVMDPVILQINGSFIEMHQNASGFWVSYVEAYYGELLNYTLYSAIDSLGNENGSKVHVLTPSFQTVTPEDDESPPINEGDILDNFDAHYHGQVEIYVSLEDHNDYQSGINESNVQLHVNINGDTFTYFMIESEELFYYNLEFEFNDIVYYWINASDNANNPNSSITRGPFIIDDNSRPTVSYSKIDWGNGTVDFYAEIVDWPSNSTTAYLLYTQNYFGTWTNLSMDQVLDVTYFTRINSLEYNLQNLWYYVASVDTAHNWNDPGITQATNFKLSDTVSPVITLSIENSTKNDGEITVFAYAIDSYGDTDYVNNTFYINFTHSRNTIMKMDYDTFYRYKASYSFPFGDQVALMIWVEDNAGNLGKINTTIFINDNAAPKIKNYGYIAYQNGTVSIWAEIIEGINGSGLVEDEIHLEYVYYAQYRDVLMEPSSTGDVYTYLISGFQAGDNFNFRLSAMDHNGNINRTTWGLGVIEDLTYPVCDNFDFKETVLNHYSSYFTFWANACDPFGILEGVNLSINYYNSSHAWSENVVMQFNGSFYVYINPIMIRNLSFNYSILIYDRAFNTIEVGNSTLRILNFQPVELLNYGIEIRQENIGKVLFWCETYDPFNDHTVNLTVFDDTNDSWMFATQMISNGTHYIYSLSLLYLHKYSYVIQVIDSGVIGEYYSPNQAPGSYQMLDYWKPVIHSSGASKINTSAIIVLANVSDWGSGVSEVYINYEFSPQNEIGGGYGSETQKKRVLMNFNQTHYVIELKLSESGTFSWQIEAFDFDNQADGIPSINGEESYSHQIPIAFDPIAAAGAIIVAIIGTILVIFTLYAVSKTYNKRKYQILSEISKSQAKLDSLLNTYVILVTTAVGLPIYTVSNIMYQSSNAIQDVLSGLSVGIDSFLESFQSDIINYFVETDSELLENQREESIRTSIIEKNKVQIQIISSPSYRIFLFLKEKPPEYVKSAFIAIVRNLEEKITLDELGVVDEALIEPVAEKVIKQYFPITLLSPFHIDCQRVRFIEEKLKRGEPINKSISRSSLNALKRLVIVKSNLDVSINDPQAQINIFDKSLAQNKLQDIPPIILNEALDIFKKILKVNTKVIYKALWIGSSPKINLVVSNKTNPHEEIPVIH